MTTSNTYGRAVDVPMVNKSGGGVIAGDVVIYDTTNNAAFTTTTSAGSTLALGVAQETIASNGTGRIRTLGYASLVNVNASVTRGHYGYTHTVAKQATDAGAARTAGTFLVFLTGGTTPDAIIYPVDLAGAALTNPMSHVGAIIIGGTAGAPTELVIGAAGGALTSLNGTAAYNSGTSFPGSAATGDRYWRTDRDLEYYYDGTRWLTTVEYSVTLFNADALQGANTAVTSAGAVDEGANGAYITRLRAWTFQGGGTSATNYVTWQLASVAPGGTNHNLGATFSTQNDTLSNHVAKAVTIGSVVTSGDANFQLSGTKTLAPTVIYAQCTVFYRLIG